MTEQVLPIIVAVVVGFVLVLGLLALVYYYVDADDLFVIALLHGRRRPGLYRGR